MKNIHVDFQIYDSNDPKQIIVLDTSIWSQIENKQSIIEIITPGSTDVITLPYFKNSVNILNANTLQLNCFECGDNFIDLPDGVYEITVKGSPDKFNKKRFYLKTTTIQGKLDDILIGVYSDCNSCSENSDEITKILRYKNLISVAEAFIRRGHKCESQKLIFKIQDFLKKFKNCKKCPHRV